MKTYKVGCEPNTFRVIYDCVSCCHSYCRHLGPDIQYNVHGHLIRVDNIEEHICTKHNFSIKLSLDKKNYVCDDFRR